MAKQTINIGTVANDGTGDPIRTAFTKTNENTTELYNVHGWGYYRDGLTTPATQVIGTTPVKLLIDGLGASSESGYLPYAIRGVSELWDTATDEITPISIGDSYDLRLDLNITAKSGLPTIINCVLDIGATPDGTGGAGSVLVVQKIISAAKTTPYSISEAFPIFSLATFIANNGTIWLSTDTGTVTVEGRGLYIGRTSAGNL